MPGSINLKKMGSFFIGGRKITISGKPLRNIDRGPGISFEIDENGTYYIEQAYVQYFIPNGSDKKKPIILVHGGGHTGNVWESTPDGREGWLQYFLQQHYPVYVIDNVERGRAGWCSHPGFWPQPPETRSEERSLTVFRIDKSEGDSSSGSQQQFPLDSLSELIKYNVPRWDCNLEASTKSLKELIEKLGGGIVVAHSQGCYFAVKAALSSQVTPNATILLEPSIMPDDSTMNYSLANKQSFLFVYGDYIEKSDFWKKMRKNSKNLKNVMHNNGARVDWIDLPNIGLKGNSHMLMMDKNNFQIVETIDKWIVMNEKEYSENSEISKLSLKQK